MTIEEYDYVKDPKARCSECGTDEDIVIDEEGEFTCTDCLFERRCRQYDETDHPPSSWVHWKGLQE